MTSPDESRLCTDCPLRAMEDTDADHRLIRSDARGDLLFVMKFWFTVGMGLGWIAAGFLIVMWFGLGRI